MFWQGMRATFVVAVMMAATTGSAAADETFYGETRGWTTVALGDNGRFTGCAATIARDGGTWGFGQHVSGQWRLAFGAPGLHGAQPVTIDIDRATFPYHTAEGDGTNLYVSVDAASLDAVRRGNRMTVTLGNGQTANMTLAGTAAAMLKVQECVQNGGRPPAAGGTLPAVPGGAAAAVENDALRGGAGCPDFRRWASLGSNTPAVLTVTNRSDRALTLYWIDFNGQPQEYAGTLPGETLQLDTYASHRWLARDFGGTCVGGVMDMAAGMNTYDLR